LNAFCTKGKDLLTVYKDKKNPYVQEVRFLLRMQYQFGAVSGEEKHAGAPKIEQEWRRFRPGVEIKFLERFKFTNIYNVGGLEGRGNVSSGEYQDNQTGGWIYELNLAYTQPEMFTFTAGKMKPRISGDYRTSSSAILTVERAALNNQLRPETVWGFQLQNPSKEDKFQWTAGVYSNREEGKYGRWADWQSGMGLISLSYKADKLLLEKGRVWLDYAFTNQNMARVPSADDGYWGLHAKNWWALTYEGKQDAWYLLIDNMLATNLQQKGSNKDNADSAYGLTILPAYSINKHWQLVSRYQYAYSNDGGVKMDSRYVSTYSPNTKSIESLHGFYAGVNYHLCGDEPHLAKIMFGLEYLTSESESSSRKGFDGWQYMLSFRTNF